MASSWDLMQLYTAVEYMHIYRERYYGVAYRVFENKAWGTRSWPTMPYPEAETIDSKAHADFSEEQILGILLAIDRPPCLVAPSLMYPKTTDGVDMFVWRKKLGRLLEEKDYGEGATNYIHLPYESMGLTNTIKQYLNFEFLRQLERAR